jgi:hypothetical protein
MSQHLRSRVAAVVVLWSVFSAGAALVCVDTPPPPKTDPKIIKWVRTTQGWERSLWLIKPEQVDMNLHPAVLAGFLALASILGLLIFPSAAEQARLAEDAGNTRPRRKPQPLLG